MAVEIGLIKPMTKAMNKTEVVRTAVSIVEYTLSGFSPSLLENLKKVVSIPYVRITRSRAV